MTILRRLRTTAASPAIAAAIIFCLSSFLAAGSQKPAEPVRDPTRAGRLVEPAKLDPTIKLDIRYATPHNFTGRPVYPEARAFLLHPAAEALLAAHKWLKQHGYGILIYDAYRPWSVTKLFWDLVPKEKRAFVADPATGSLHNRGCAVDVGLYEISTGREVEMPSAYDELTARSATTYRGGTEAQRASRDLLRKGMERGGLFLSFHREWWHYGLKGCRNHPVLDIPFSAIRSEEAGQSPAAEIGPKTGRQMPGGSNL